MRARRIFLRITAIILASALPIAASAQNSGSFQISAQVPMACWVNHTVPAEAITGGAGSVTEGCNNSAGYAVYVDHRPLTATESVRLQYGDQTTNLAGSSVTEVSRRYGPNVQKVSYSFSHVQLREPLTLNIMIQAI